MISSMSWSGAAQSSEGLKVRHTLSNINFKHAWLNNLMNSVSSSLSVYQGPPVISADGSRWKSMYILRLRC